MREEDEFDKLWCNIDREVEQKRHEDDLKMAVQKKSEKQSRRKTKKEQLYRGNTFGRLQIEDTGSFNLGRRSRRSKASSESSIFDPAASLSDLSIDDCNSWVPGISGTALGLISDMQEPSRSCMKEFPIMDSKKRRPATSKARGRSPCFNDKTALYRTLQSPSDYTAYSSDAPIQIVDRQIHKAHDELVNLKAVTLKSDIVW